MNACYASHPIGIRRCLAVLALAAFVAGSRAHAAAPVEFLQVFKDGTDGISIRDHVGALAVRGDYLYASIVYCGQIKIFKRDFATGKLAFQEDWNADDPKMVVGTMAWANGRLYMNCGVGHWSGDGDSRGLRWLEMDEKTGKLTEKGNLKIPISSGLEVSPDQKHLYVLLRQQKKVLHYTLDADGTPRPAGEAIFADAKGDVFRFKLAPDGKALYGMYGGTPYVLGCMEIGADGAPEYKKAFPLDKLTEGVEWPKGKWGYGWGRNFHFSPDGTQVYADFCNYGGKDPRMALYARDPKTHELTFTARVEGGAPASMVRLEALAFEADGTRAYFASGSECSGNIVGWADRDPKTGHFTGGGAVKETARGGPDSLVYDAEHGLLYAGTWASKSLFVLKVNKGAATQTAAQR
ncbi:MAG: hypothetical protein KIS92_23955 [Planctomycetota bacterium]|nr:hypothetical protein [Planctomycetota bacterium]